MSKINRNNRQEKDHQRFHRGDLMDTDYKTTMLTGFEVLTDKLEDLFRTQESITKK